MMHVRFTTYNRSFLKQSFVESQHQGSLIELLKLLEKYTFSYSNKMVQ